MNTEIEQFWKLISNFEDYLTSGYERPLEIPQFSSLTLPGCEEGAACEEEQNQDLETLGKEILFCTKCGLSRTRHLAVPGEGNACPTVVVVGEGPGGEEDKTGKPFVGTAGRYLDKWLSAIGLTRDTNCYICNIVKCRPPGNRDPEEDEINACLPYLYRQLDLLRPKAILTAGRISSRIITGIDSGIGILRGKTYSFKGIPLVPTYHPSAVLRNQDLRRPVWDDLKQLKSILDNL